MTTYLIPFDQLDEESLLTLVDSEVPEGIQLEYKSEEIHLTSLVEELVAFANTQGGDLFIGISESGGVAEKVEGITLENVTLDQLVQKYTQALAGKTDPSITNAQIRGIKLTNGRYVIAIRVPKSWNGPHMVKENFKFLVRTSAGKQPIGTAALRRLFGMRDQFLQQYERFRVQRIEKTINIYRMRPPFLMVHYVPVTAFDGDIRYPLIDCMDNIDYSILGSSGGNPRINAHGLFNCVRSSDNQGGHTQLFRNGIVEQVSNYAFGISKEDPSERFDIIFLDAVERHLKSAMQRQIRNFKVIGMRDPFYYFVQIVGGRGLRNELEDQELDDDFLQIYENLIDNTDSQSIEKHLSTVITLFWNAFGQKEKPKL